MFVGRNFSDSDVGEDEVYAFEFANELAPGETIVSSSWTCKVVTGKDSHAASCVNGPATVQATRSLQRITGLKADVMYVLTADIVTNQSNTKSLWSFVNCKNPG